MSRNLKVTPNSLLGPFSEGMVLSEQYLREVHKADINHMLRNKAVEVTDEPLSLINQADLTPLVAAPPPQPGTNIPPIIIGEDGVATQAGQPVLVGTQQEADQQEEKKLVGGGTSTASTNLKLNTPPALLKPAPAVVNKGEGEEDKELPPTGHVKLDGPEEINTGHRTVEEVRPPRESKKDGK